MKKKKADWRIWTAAVLLVILILTILLPGASIRAGDYMDAAVSVNEYAAAQQPGEQEFANTAQAYRSDAAKKEMFASQFPQVSVNRIGLSRMALKTGGNASVFDMIHLKEGYTFRSAGIVPAFRFWGWMIILPVLLCMVTAIFVLVKQTLYAVWLVADGAVIFLCGLLEHFLVPHYFWGRLYAVIDSFSLVSNEALQISGAGDLFVKTLYTRSTGASWVFVLIMGCVILFYGVMCLTVWRKRRTADGYEQDYDYIFREETGVYGRKTQTVSGHRAAGELRGIRGEYAGQVIPLQQGEEIIFGRDPQYCMLIFQNAGVSRRQCGIRYDAAKGYYQAIDYSSVGTMLSDGTILTTSEYTTLLPGTVIYLAGGTEAFMVL